MPVTTTHDDYTDYRQRWRRCRDAAAGKDRVKLRGQAYLPKLEGHTPDEYKDYKKRANWYNAYNRTVNGLEGMVFRKDLQYEIPNQMQNIVEDITMKDEDLQAFGKRLVHEQLEVGRCGILVDYPPVDIEDEEMVITQAMAEELGLRPYLTLYHAEDIRLWQTTKRGAETKVKRVVLYEEVKERGADEFVSVDVQQYRVLELDEEGQYRQRIFRVDPDSDVNENDDEEPEFIEYQIFYPKVDGETFDEIPFTFCNVRNIKPAVENPPLLDLADMNYSHYQTSAELEHALLYTSVPTAVITGMDPEENDNFYIGARAAWQIPDADAEAKYLEFEGKGLEHLENAMDRKEEMMANLGARMLAPEKAQAEATETVKLRRMGEDSMLVSLAKTGSLALTRSLEYMAEWQGIDPESNDINVTLNTDFMPVPMDPQLLRELFRSWQGGAIDYEALFKSLQQGEIIGKDRTPEEVQENVQQNNGQPSLSEL